MAKIARVARRENLAKIGMRSLLNNFVVPENPRPFNAEDPARQRQGINPNIEYRNPKQIRNSNIKFSKLFLLLF
jgi:hypothetical protein